MSEIKGCPNCGNEEIKFIYDEYKEKYRWIIALEPYDNYWSQFIGYCPFCGVLLLEDGTFKR